MKFKKFLKRHQYLILFAFAGLIGGYLYYHYVGCVSGACPMKRLWYYNMLIGGLLGYVVGDTIDSWINKRKSKKIKDEKTTEN